jgi:hypothetical protein
METLIVTSQGLCNAATAVRNTFPVIYVVFIFYSMNEAGDQLFQNLVSKPRSVGIFRLQYKVSKPEFLYRTVHIAESWKASFLSDSTRYRKWIGSVTRMNVLSEVDQNWCPEKNHEDET